MREPRKKRRMRSGAIQETLYLRLAVPSLLEVDMAFTDNTKVSLVIVVDFHG